MSSECCTIEIHFTSWITVSTILSSQEVSGAREKTKKDFFEDSIAFFQIQEHNIYRKHAFRRSDSNSNIVDSFVPAFRHHHYRIRLDEYTGNPNANIYCSDGDVFCYR